MAFLAMQFLFLAPSPISVSTLSPEVGVSCLMEKKNNRSEIAY